MKRVSMILDDEEHQEEHGLTDLTTAEKQSGTLQLHTPENIKSWTLAERDFMGTW